MLASGAWTSSRWHLPCSVFDTLWGILGWIIFGLIVGIVARFLMPGHDPAGFVVTAVLGIVGALLGGFFGRSVGWYAAGEPAGFVMAIVGAVVLLVLYRLITGRSRAAIRR